MDERALQAAGLLDQQLDMQDDKDQAALDRMQSPPQPQPSAPGQQQQKPGNGKQPGAKPAGPPTGQTPLEKMIAASFARRMQRMAGPRFGITTETRKRGASRRGMSPLQNILAQAAQRNGHNHGRPKR
jgi:hypothetical protein